MSSRTHASSPASPTAGTALPARRHAGPLRIGLTGGIGSGKSSVASILAAAGAALIDADAISRRLTASGGAAIPALRLAFGPGILDAGQALDRDAMRQRLISDTQAKATLEQILHPLIRAEIDRQIEANADAPCIVIEIPLLAEAIAEWRPRLDRVLVVDCSVERQIQRVMSRSGWPRDTVCGIIARQASRERRRAIADAVIDNEGEDMTKLRRTVLATVLPWAPGLIAQ